MDEFLDMVWDRIMDAILGIAAWLDWALAPLTASIGPALVILLLVVAVIALSKYLGKKYNTRRYVELKENYEYWYSLRQEAMACEDREKAKALARNIDQAQLNKAYYDYFFEGFLKSIATAILPILFAAAYINHAYGPQKLTQLIGREFLFVFSRQGGDPVKVSAFFWLVICLVLVHLVWFAVAITVKSRLNRPKE